MSNYNRINLDLTDLSPESASNIFLFLHNCLENEFSLEYYNNNILKYSIQERYFILNYAKQYFSNSPKSYLNKWMESQAKLIDGGEHRERLPDFFFRLSTNADIFLTFLKQSENTIKRQAKKTKKTGLSITTQNKLYDYRIPLYFKTDNKRDFSGLSSSEINLKSFKIMTKEIIGEIMDSEQFEDFFNNSFSFQGNLDKIKLLNIEMGNRTIAYSQFFHLYSYYDDERKYQNKVIGHYYNRLIEERVRQKKNLPEIRGKFMKIPTIPYLGTVTRFDFMKIMYNTFPLIREQASEYLLKHPESDLDSYLKTKCRNINA